MQSRTHPSVSGHPTTAWRAAPGSVRHRRVARKSGEDRPTQRSCPIDDDHVTNNVFLALLLEHGFPRGGCRNARRGLLRPLRLPPLRQSRKTQKPGLGAFHLRGGQQASRQVIAATATTAVHDNTRRHREPAAPHEQETGSSQASRQEPVSSGGGGGTDNLATARTGAADGSYSQEEDIRRLANWIIGAGLPWTVVDSPEFQQVLLLRRPNAPVPSSSMIKHEVIRSLTAEKVEIE